MDEATLAQPAPARDFPPAPPIRHRCSCGATVTLSPRPSSSYVPAWWSERASEAGLVPGLELLRSWYVAGRSDALEEAPQPTPPRAPYHCAAYMDGWGAGRRELELAREGAR